MANLKKNGLILNGLILKCLKSRTYMMEYARELKISEEERSNDLS